jgi:hypothetical protein
MDSMMSPNSMEYVKCVFLSTVDGCYSLVVSFFYYLIGLMVYSEAWDPADNLGIERDLGGYMLMPVAFLVTHLSYRMGVDLGKRLHIPSVIGVSILALMMPALRMGFLRLG